MSRHNNYDMEAAGGSNYQSSESQANLSERVLNSNLQANANEFIPIWYEGSSNNEQYNRNNQGNSYQTYNQSESYYRNPCTYYADNFQQNFTNLQLDENSTNHHNNNNRRQYYNKNRNYYNRGYDNYDRQQVDHRYDNRNSNGRYRNYDNYYSQERNHHTNYYKSNKNNKTWKSSPPQNDVEEIVESKTSELTQRDKLVNEIDSGNLECLVCCESIKPFQPIWSCPNCYHILHLNCTTKWAMSSKADDGGWRCPACQNINSRIPRIYYCFCGKTKNPEYNRNDLAHTCGELCERKVNCEHSCTQLCHPGPCPPCQATVTRYCGCGQTTRIMQCNQKDDVKCSEICNKLLNCEIHICQEICHKDECKTCTETIKHKCFCNKNNREVPCTKENRECLNYSCGKTCNRMLSCKNHRCTKICHDGDCGECKLSTKLITSCPCGKLRVIEGQRKSCLEPVPLCSGTCKKILKCGPPNAPHTCSARCHSGECPPCHKETSIKCRCGVMNQMIKCRDLSTRADDARCKKRCAKKNNCGKHKCNQECCIDIDHVCPLQCTYSLSCGKHKCNQPCHKGRCLPCHRTSFEELYCECGANVIYPPVPCGTKRPICDQPCRRQHPCDHPVQHNCHSATSCPPCMILTTKYCHGKHEKRKTIPCSQTEFSCGLPCGKPLRCTRHKCIKTCHAGECMTEGEVCKQNCTKIRDNCGHKCNAPCHDGECPDTPCREMVEVVCECGRRKQMRSCQDFVTDYRRIASANFASSMQEMQRGHSVELCDILGPVKPSSNNKTLDCNDDCKLAERNRRLELGLQIINPNLRESATKFQPKYSDFLKGFAKKDSSFVKDIHDKLTELVKLAKDSKQKSRSYSFPVMNREKRQVVHDLSAMFGVESVAYDKEPNRNVVATAYKDRTWLPSMSVLEVMEREIGQRRVKVPTNPWSMKK